MSIIKAALVVICVASFASAQSGTVITSTGTNYQPNETSTVLFQQTQIQPVYGQQLFPQTTQSPSTSQQTQQSQLGPQYQSLQQGPTNSPQLFQFVGMLLPYDKSNL